MKKKVLINVFLMLAVMLLAGCSVSKFIPEGSYLLDDVKIESDNKEIKSSQMNLYVRLMPNGSVLSSFPCIFIVLQGWILQNG